MKVNGTAVMPKTEELKERINYLKGFLTILLGVVVLLSGGLVNLYLSDVINEVFWLGVGIVVFQSNVKDRRAP